MKLNLPAGTMVQGATFGTPRVGNAAWATYFDSQVTDFKRMNNKRDPVPTVPPYDLGFRHPSGEIHIGWDGVAVACPGERFFLFRAFVPPFTLVTLSLQALTTTWIQVVAIKWCRISWKETYWTTSGRTTAYLSARYFARLEVSDKLAIIPYFPHGPTLYVCHMCSVAMILPS